MKVGSNKEITGNNENRSILICIYLCRIPYIRMRLNLLSMKRWLKNVLKCNICIYRHNARLNI